MNFLSNVLDSIPVVGTVKGLVHYATGDTDGGNKAIYQSTRTTAVLAAGADGCLAGPAGGALAAMSAGAATDALASAAMNEKQGIFQSLDKIKDDIDEGRVPTGSIVSAGLVLGLDGLGGLGMGGISSAASKVSEKAVAKTMENVEKQVATIVGEEVIEKSVGMTAKEIAKIATKKVSEKTIEQVALQAEIVLVSTHIGLNAEKRTQEKRAEEERERRAREERERREREERERRAREEGKNRASEGRKKPPAAGSGSSQPPQGNKNNEKSEEKIEPDYFDILMQLLRELLKLIYGKDPEPFSRIFKKLSEGQVTYLVKKYL